VSVPVKFVTISLALIPILDNCNAYVPIVNLLNKAHSFICAVTCDCHYTCI